MITQNIMGKTVAGVTGRNEHQRSYWGQRLLVWLGEQGQKANKINKFPSCFLKPPVISR